MRIARPAVRWVDVVKIIGADIGRGRPANHRSRIREAPLRADKALVTNPLARNRSIAAYALVRVRRDAQLPARLGFEAIPHGQRLVAIGFAPSRLVEMLLRHGRVDRRGRHGAIGQH